MIDKTPVSYTHLDVYKRQVVHPVGCPAAAGVGFVTVEVHVGSSNAIHGSDRALGNILDVGKITLHLAMIEDVDRSAFKYGAGE